MAIRDRYVCRILAVEPYPEGAVKVDVKFIYMLWDTVAGAEVAGSEKELRHQDIIVPYETIAAIDANPLNISIAKKRQALEDAIGAICLGWKADQSYIAFVDFNAWMPNGWPTTPDDVVLR